MKYINDYLKYDIRIINKVFLSIIFIFTIIQNLNPADENHIADIYNRLNEGVIYIEQALFFKSEDFKNKATFTDIEKKYNIKLLDNYFTLISGSGFFITKNGYFITNYHVIDQSEIETIKKKMLDILVFSIMIKIPEKEARYYYDKIYSDLSNAIKTSNLVCHVIVKEKENYIPDIIMYNKDKDIALLKIENKDNNFKSLYLDDLNNLKYGDSVIAIGYPLSNSSISFLHDLKSTVTFGNVSSIRTDNWGIQHTAAINHGNSGGPLINMNGKVVGINVGLVVNSNSMYFSIPVIILKNWLKENKMDYIIENNKKDGK